MKWCYRNIHKFPSKKKKKISINILHSCLFIRSSKLKKDPSFSLSVSDIAAKFRRTISLRSPKSIQNKYFSSVHPKFRLNCHTPLWDPGDWIRSDQIRSTAPSMAAPRNLTALKDEESGMELEDDSPTSKKPKSERFPLNTWEFAVAVAVFFVFSIGLFCIYLTMPASTSANLKLPRTLSDLRTLKYFFPLLFIFIKSRSF